METNPPDRISWYEYRNNSDRNDVVITRTVQEYDLPSGVSWSYHGPFNPQRADFAFGVNDARVVREAIRQRGYCRVRVKRGLRRP